MGPLRRSVYRAVVVMTVVLSGLTSLTVAVASPPQATEAAALSSEITDNPTKDCPFLFNAPDLESGAISAFTPEQAAEIDGLLGPGDRRLIRLLGSL